VCRQLGFPLGAISALTESPFGSVSRPFSYNDVQCVGNETTLDSCSHQNTHNCYTSNGAGVICNRGLGNNFRTKHFWIDPISN
jgi:hypothetical protein